MKKLINEQGIAQGCLLAITSLSSVISPLIYSPLSGKSKTYPNKIWPGPIPSQLQLAMIEISGPGRFIFYLSFYPRCSCMLGPENKGMDLHSPRNWPDQSSGRAEPRHI